MINETIGPALVGQDMTNQLSIDKILANLPLTSHAAMLGANLLKLKPCIRVEDGKNVVGSKFMGNIKNCVKKYIEETLKMFNNPDHTRALVVYPSATVAMVKAAEETLEKYGKFKEVHFVNAGSVIASHCGPNTLGLMYLNDGDEGHY